MIAESVFSDELGERIRERRASEKKVSRKARITPPCTFCRDENVMIASSINQSLHQSMHHIDSAQEKLDNLAALGYQQTIGLEIRGFGSERMESQSRGTTLRESAVCGK